MSQDTAPRSNRLDSGASLVSGQYLESKNGIYRFGFGVHQDLVIHKEFPQHMGRDLWSPTENFPVAKCVMDKNGNLVCYDENNGPMWVSGTYGNQGGYAVMEENGELAIYRKDGTRVWYSPTVQGDSGPRAVLRDPKTDTMKPGEMLIAEDAIHSKNGQYQLIMQGDGNLVFYRGSGSRDPKDALWASGTLRRDSVSAIMQVDGNFVVYDDKGNALWASRTDGHPGAYLVAQDDGNLVIYGQDNHALWDRYKKA